MNHRIFLLTILCCCSMLVVSVAGAQDTPQGLDRILHGVTMGASFSDVATAHPEAKYSDADIRDIPVSSEQPGALLLKYDEDPLLGLHASVNIGFKEGAVYELVAVWSGSGEDVANRRRRFFTAAIQRHGQTYLRETILVYPHTPEERPAAVFMWQEKDAVILVFYTSASPIDPHPKAALTYAQFQPDDPFLKDIMEKYPPSDVQRDEAWKTVVDILPLLESVEQTTVQP